jgi:hypothetical protein
VNVAGLTGVWLTMEIRLLKKPRLVLHVPGATPEQVKRGLKAAQDYFAAAGVSPADARAALSKIEDEDIGVPDVEISDREASIWHHWTEAQAVALEACSGHMKNVPPHSWLDYRTHHAGDEKRRSLQFFKDHKRPIATIYRHFS